ncbi:hypothetical protein PG997_012264 [Apiospora hydei]|uniref:NADP-dependent oxidoreductase domain-containing protein n=1 Tax=Apiospora hydei TaxID=1337664 RepID=A0ABR1V2W8_9PEZI
MESNPTQPLRAEQCTIAGSLRIPRMINGLWQLAGGHDTDIDIAMAAKAMIPLIDAGLWCFDMADHYGDAELVVGQFNASTTDDSRKLTAFTKWCPPEDGEKSFENAEAAVNRALARMGQNSIALMQYHIWDYSDDTYLHNLDHLRRLQRQGKIQHIGLTNTDAAHLEQLLQSGLPIATNQIPCSVIDRRVIQRKPRLGMRRARSRPLGLWNPPRSGSGPKSPQDMDALNWSLRKYLRFIRAAGGWATFQRVLRCLASVAQKHGVPIAAVATRWVLDIPVVSAVIVACGGPNSTWRPSLFALDDADREAIAEAQRGLTDIPGDCGDEYRRAPYLTATGDLSHHLKGIKAAEVVE